MLPAVNRGAGKNIGFPDVCMTPAGVAVVPMPYPNQAAHAMAMGFSPNVFLGGKSALNLASTIPMTSGMEAGSAHPMLKMMGKFTTGNPIVSINNLPGIHLTCLTTGNAMNNGLGLVMKTGVTNVFYTFVPHDPDIDALAEEVAPAVRSAGPPLEHSREGNVGFIRIHVFSADVPARLWGALRTLAQDGAEVVVVDLRGNPGGLFSAFVDAASLFLPAGTTIATFVDNDGDETEYRSSGEQPCALPLVLFVDEQTASAAELFAECLENHGRAELIGGPMFGKKTAYSVVEAEGGWTAVAEGRAEVRGPLGAAAR